MKVTTHLNGSIQLVLEPENTIERAVIELVLERAQKGAVVKIDSAEKGLSLTMAE